MYIHSLASYEHIVCEITKYVMIIILGYFVARSYNFQLKYM